MDEDIISFSYRNNVVRVVVTVFYILSSIVTADQLILNLTILLNIYKNYKNNQEIINKSYNNIIDNNNNSNNIKIYNNYNNIVQKANERTLISIKLVRIFKDFINILFKQQGIEIFYQLTTVTLTTRKLHLLTTTAVAENATTAVTTARTATTSTLSTNCLKKSYKKTKIKSINTKTATEKIFNLKLRTKLPEKLPKYQQLQQHQQQHQQQQPEVVKHLAKPKTCQRLSFALDFLIHHCILLTLNNLKTFQKIFSNLIGKFEKNFPQNHGKHREEKFKEIELENSEKFNFKKLFILIKLKVKLLLQLQQHKQLLLQQQQQQQQEQILKHSTRKEQQLLLLPQQLKLQLQQLLLNKPAKTKTKTTETETERTTTTTRTTRITLPTNKNILIFF